MINKLCEPLKILIEIINFLTTNQFKCFQCGLLVFDFCVIFNYKIGESSSGDFPSSTVACSALLNFPYGGCLGKFLRSQKIFYL